ncbi:MAG: DUF4321 domain-containing protein [Syntrophomonadaceae bacterium]|jgi:hypothetical protein
MANKAYSYSGWQVMLLLLIVGGVISGWIGDALIDIWPILGTVGKVQSVGIPSFTIDLNIFSFTFGFMLHISLFTIIGFVLAFLVYRRL